MRRDLSVLAADRFDVLVIGGGIHGAFAAWDASLRGLRVALVDRADFASGTSGNSLKIAHGGLRYLQRLDLARMRRSSAERSTLIRLAPNLLRPLPCLVSTRGVGRDSRLAFKIGLAINDLVTWDRNRDLPPESAIPRGRLLGRAECVARFPGFDRDGLSGGALWYDAQILHPERLVVSVIAAAAASGAVVANYAEVTDLLAENGVVRGAVLADRLRHGSVIVRARSVINAAGPWAHSIPAVTRLGNAPRFARAINLVVRRPVGDCAVGVRSRTGPAGDPVNGGHRFMFCCPWREHTLVGTSYAVDPGDRQPVRLDEITSLLDEINAACPSLGFSLDDVTFFHWGLVPLKDGVESGRWNALAEHARIVHHAPEGLRGLVSVVGPKFTTARQVAARAVTMAVTVAGFPAGPERSARARLTVADPGPGVPSPAERRLEELYGPRAGAVAAVLAERPEWAEPLAPSTPVSRGEVVYAVRAEMACRLSDFVFRRTELGTAGPPSAEALEAAARVMGEMLGWSPEERQREIESVHAAYAPLPFAPTSRVGAPG